MLYSGEVESGGRLGENGRGCGKGGGRGESGRRRGRELRKNGQYFVTEKKDKGKEGQEKRGRDPGLQSMGGGKPTPYLVS